MSALQVGSPHTIQMIRTLRTPFYREIEHDLHLRYAAKHVRGEWFALAENDLLYIRLLGASGELREDFLEGAARARARFLERTGSEYVDTYND
jgi:T5orf172 domain.